MMLRTEAMTDALSRNWWLLLLRGVLAIALGGLILFAPGIALESLILLFGVYMLVDGLFGIASGIRAATRHERWGLLVFEGILSLLAGVAAVLLPGITLILFIALLAAWAILSGLVMLVAAFRVQRARGRGMMALAGLLSAVWGALLFFAPVTGALVLTLWLGVYALVFGVLLLVLAFRLRGRRHAASFKAISPA